MNIPSGYITDYQVLINRGEKNSVSADLPYAWLTETERSSSGTTEKTGVIFLTNRECPFRCIMCDLWKNTTDESVPPGSVPHQIKTALSNMTGIKQLKLYNSGSFFDTKAIPLSDYTEIASLIQNLDTVIVESHPKLVGRNCLKFSKMLKPELEVAMGLETVNEKVLKLLNKKMTPDDFRRASAYMLSKGISVRAFILLRPPFMDEEEGVYWAVKSIEYAFNSGAGCCTVIPVRGGNGIMELLAAKGFFQPPSLKSLEKVLEYGISLDKGRVFADTWDLHLFSSCNKCLNARRERIIQMNLLQKILPPVNCDCGIK